METKICKECLQEKPLDEFHRALSGSEKRRNKCKFCVSKYDRSRKDAKLAQQKIRRSTREYRDKSNAYQREYRAKNKGRWYDPEKEWARSLKKKFNMTVEKYNELLSLQNEGCAICEEVCATGQRLGVDHDHTCCPGIISCGECVRGLLCRRCNTAIGYFGDNLDRLRSALNYLREHSNILGD